MLQLYTECTQGENFEKHCSKKIEDTSDIFIKQKFVIEFNRSSLLKKQKVSLKHKGLKSISLITA